MTSLGEREVVSTQPNRLQLLASELLAVSGAAPLIGYMRVPEPRNIIQKESIPLEAIDSTHWDRRGDQLLG